MGTEGEKGFTLIELLVVVIIIGILAGIAIPTFLSQRANAQDAQAKSTLRNAQTAIVSYRQVENELPPGSAAARAKLVEFESTTNWKASSGANDRPSVGRVPFELWTTDSVFGTRSASNRCFYIRITPAGQTRYGSDTICEDPWETARDGRIVSAGW